MFKCEPGMWDEVTQELLTELRAYREAHRDEYIGNVHRSVYEHAERERQAAKMFEDTLHSLYMEGLPDE